MSKKIVHDKRGGWEQPSTPTDDTKNLLEVPTANNADKPITLVERATFTLVDSEGKPLPGKSPMNYEEFMRYKANADRIESVALAITSVGYVVVSAFQTALYWALVSFLVACINYLTKWLFFLLQQKWIQYKKGK